MITITSVAAAKVKELMRAENRPDSHGLRLGVVGGGCSGLQYKMDFCDEAEKGDLKFDCEGVNLFVDSRSYLYLNGTVIDFVDGLNGAGFTFSNPNVRQSCGCGVSFTAEPSPDMEAAPVGSAPQSCH